MFAGGVLSWLVLLPLLSIMGNYMTVPFPPVPASGLRIDQMSPGQLWSAYIRYTGAGAVLAAGLITLARTIPTIVSSFRESVKDFSAKADAGGRARTEHDLPLTSCWRNAAAGDLPARSPPDADAGQRARVAAGDRLRFLLRYRVVADYRAHRFVLQPDSSGMTIATLILTCRCLSRSAGPATPMGPVAICVGAVVCIAAANHGAETRGM